MSDIRTHTPGSGACIDRIGVAAYQVPTDGPDGEEADGTLTWQSTTIIVVTAVAEGVTGIGYTYGDVAVAHLIESKLTSVVEGGDPFQVSSLWYQQMVKLRNAGRSGAGAMALAAVDIALWDLKSKLLGVPLFRALPAFHDQVPVYGSGGFCNYPLKRLQDQVAGWVEQGIPRVKVKTSRHPEQDPKRLGACREVIGDTVELMTDANGALTRKDALLWAHRFREQWNVGWFEEPVTSDDRTGCG